MLLAIFFGFLLFGLYAFAGGLAIVAGWGIPIAWRAMVGLLPVALLYTLCTVLLAPKFAMPMTLNLWLQHVMMVAGWGLGLWSNQKTETVTQVAGQ
jgi:hypothetical protein